MRFFFAYIRIYILVRVCVCGCVCPFDQSRLATLVKIFNKIRRAIVYEIYFDFSVVQKYMYVCVFIYIRPTKNSICLAVTINVPPLNETNRVSIQGCAS